ncbi:uncharacterized protein BJ212DRAFT_1383237 [Suillus subaureus]|uniref:Secreted protein n=1 Tax=Suillus subaureus TaxID=48587 RepID=A0A9P7E0Y9_9AGAM|nr:uncharacterized protein BJ212DRAFT_1383237 [Suillus subaureus]KAG1808398.1 hypothetical protein BJ212DRAFT_1383237 [Suillus subaureus]
MMVLSISAAGLPSLKSLLVISVGSQCTPSKFSVRGLIQCGMRRFPHPAQIFVPGICRLARNSPSPVPVIWLSYHRNENNVVVGNAAMMKTRTTLDPSCN